MSWRILWWTYLKLLLWSLAKAVTPCPNHDIKPLHSPTSAIYTISLVLLSSQWRWALLWLRLKLPMNKFSNFKSYLVFWRYWYNFLWPVYEYIEWWKLCIHTYNYIQQNLSNLAISWLGSCWFSEVFIFWKPKPITKPSLEDIIKVYKGQNNEKNLHKTECLKEAGANKRLKALRTRAPHKGSAHTKNYNQKAWFLGGMPLF